jgi:hypothetical protein
MQDAGTGSDDASGADASTGPSGGDAAGTADGAEVADAADAAGEAGDAIACAAPSTVPVCNPVLNTGCFLLQCDVDTTQSTPTGQCVGGGLAATGATCTAASGSEACQAQSTCTGGTCRRVCFCDTDCASGQCCSEALGTTGFKLCAACR